MGTRKKYTGKRLLTVLLASLLLLQGAGTGALAASDGDSDASQVAVSSSPPSETGDEAGQPPLPGDDTGSPSHTSSAPSDPGASSEASIPPEASDPSLPGSSGASDLSDPDSLPEDGDGSGMLGMSPKPVPSPDVAKSIVDYLTAASISPATIITGIYLADTNGVQLPGLPPVLTIGQTLRLYVEFSIPNAILQDIQVGDFYQLSLPTNISVTGDLDFPLDSSQGVMGQVHVDAANRLITITFGSIEPLGENITGKLYLQGTLDASSILTPGDHDIVIPHLDSIAPVSIIVKPVVNSNVQKSGYFPHTYNPDQIIWDVDVNRGLDVLNHAVLTETFPVGTSYVSAAVYSVKVDLNGNVVPGSLVLADPQDYTVDSAGTVTFKSPINSAYRVEYTTSIQEKPAQGGNKTYTNTAKFTSDEGGELSTTASVQGRFGEALRKVTASYDPITQTFGWKIYYNFNEKAISRADAYLIDTYNTNVLDLDLNSMVLNKVTFNDTGTPLIGDVLAENLDYQVSTSGTGFRIDFLQDVNYAVSIRYSTKVKGIVDANSTAVNNVEDGTRERSSSNGNIKQQALIKSVHSVDLSTKIITWRIAVNSNNNNMHNWVLTDKLTPGIPNQKFVDEASPVTVVDNTASRTLVKDTDYTLVPEAASDLGFTLSFIGNYAITDHSFTITLKTNYDTQGLAPGVKLVNSVEANWRDNENNAHKNTNSANYSPTLADLNNGSKSGSYNYVTQQITWAVLVDYFKKDMENGVLTDPMGEGQTFVLGSLRIFNYSIQPSSGKPIKGSELTALEYADLVVGTPVASNNNTLTIRFPDGSTRYWVEFNTSVRGTMVAATYSNTAHFANDNFVDVDLTATVPVAGGGKQVGKVGKHLTDGVWWTLTINQSQSFMENVVLTDTPSTNQLVDESTIVIYGTTIDAATGTLTANTNVVLEQGVDYTYTYAQNASGVWELKVNFNIFIARAYIMKYRTDVLPGESNTATVTNTASIYGENISGTTDSITQNLSINTSSGGGIIAGTLGSFTIEKQSLATSAALPGAVFQVYTTSNEKFGGQIITGADGKVTFTNIPYRDYILKEVTAPTGYTITPELAAGVSIRVNAATTTGGTPFVFQNPPEEERDTSSSSSSVSSSQSVDPGPPVPSSSSQPTPSSASAVASSASVTPSSSSAASSSAPSAPSDPSGSSSVAPNGGASTHSASASSASGESRSPKTGDESHVLLYMSLFFCSAAALVVALVKVGKVHPKKHRNDKNQPKE